MTGDSADWPDAKKHLIEWCPFCSCVMPEIDEGYWQCPKCKSYWDRRKKSCKKSAAQVQPRQTDGTD